MGTTLRDSPVFICGHPKSGTSLLSSLFDSHPQLIVYPEESVFFRRFLPLSENVSLEAQLDLAEAYLIHMFAWNRNDPPTSQKGFPDRDYSAIPYEEVRRSFRTLLLEARPRHRGDLLSAAVVSYGRTTGKIGGSVRRWVEKSPYNEHFAGLIYTWWQDAKCIHIVRDPRDNYFSYRRKHPDWTPAFFATNWLRSVKAGLENKSKFGAQRYSIVRYEDLVRSPAETLERICSFLHIEMDESMLQPTRAGLPWEGNSMFAGKFDRIDASPVGRWERAAETDEIAEISWIARRQIKQMGYKQVENIPLAVKVRGELWSLKQSLYGMRQRGSASFKRSPERLSGAADTISFPPDLQDP